MRRTVTAVVAVVVATAAGCAVGAWLFAERVTMCVDGVSQDGTAAGFCEDQVHQSVPGALLTGAALGLVTLAVVAVTVRRARRSPARPEPG